MPRRWVGSREVHPSGQSESALKVPGGLAEGGEGESVCVSRVSCTTHHRHQPNRTLALPKPGELKDILRALQGK